MVSNAYSGSCPLRLVLRNRLILVQIRVLSRGTDSFTEDGANDKAPRDHPPDRRTATQEISPVL